VHVVNENRLVLPPDLRVLFDWNVDDMAIFVRHARVEDLDAL
jgi:hypothetical protein